MLFKSDSRGTSITFSYLITFSIGIVLLSGVLYGIGNVEENYQKQLAEDHLEVIGNEVTVELQYQQKILEDHRTNQDEVAELGSGTNTELESITRVQTPSNILSSEYIVQIGPNGKSVRVILTTDMQSITVSLPSNIDVKPNSGAPGTNVGIVYNSTTDQLALKDPNR